MDMPVDYTTFQKNLRDLIESRGKTARELADDVNISHVTISRYLNGHREPDLKYVMLLAQYFDVSIDWLLGFNGDKFDVLPPAIQEFATLYSLASPDDRKVVEAVLNKYREEK